MSSVLQEGADGVTREGRVRERERERGRRGERERRGERHRQTEREREREREREGEGGGERERERSGGYTFTTAYCAIQLRNHGDFSVVVPDTQCNLPPAKQTRCKVNKIHTTFHTSKQVQKG